MRWKACGHFDDLLWKEWESEFFVFDPKSGQTHVLNALSARILRELRRRPAEPEVLRSAMQSGIPPAQQEQFDSALRQHLALLDDLGLAVPEDRAEIEYPGSLL